MNKINEFDTVREKLINMATAVSAFVVLLSLIPSLSQYFEIAWQPIFSLHIAVSILLILLFIFRKRVHLKVKAHFLFIVILVFSISTVINFKTVNSAFIFLLIVSISTIMFGKIVGIIYASIFILLFSIIGYLHTNNILNAHVDFNKYVNNKSTWLAITTGYAFTLIVLIKSVDLFYNYYIDAIKLNKSKNEELLRALDTLELSEKRYMSIFKGSKDGFVFVDERFRILNCNNSFQKLMGYSLEELKGKDYKSLIYTKDINWDSSFLLSVASNPENKVELELVHKNGGLIPVEKSLYQAEYKDSTFMWAVVRDLREKKALERKVFSTMIYAEENERERYARELHDGLGPLLSTSMIYLHTIKEEQEQELIKEYAARAYSILKDATRTVKEISNNLSPLILKEYGIAQALRSFIEKAEQATKIKFTIIQELTKRFSETIEFTIYRTLVELINNSLKHSRAKEVIISFKYEQQDTVIYYCDDGEGFNYEEAILSKNGFGLLNLENRIKKIGGEYNYITAPGNGVQVSIKLVKTTDD